MGWRIESHAPRQDWPVYRFFTGTDPAPARRKYDELADSDTRWLLLRLIEHHRDGTEKEIDRGA